MKSALEGVMAYGVVVGVLLCGVGVSGSAWAGLMVSGTILGEAESDPGSGEPESAQGDIETRSETIGLGFSEIDFISQSKFQEVTGVEQRADVFEGGLVLGGLLESRSVNEGFATRGSMEAAVLVVPTVMELYDFAVSVSLGAGTAGTLKLEEVGAGSSALFSFSGNGDAGPSGEQVFAEQFLLTAGTTYELTVSFTSGVTRDEAPASTAADYEVVFFPVPEPGALGLVITGIAVGLCIRRRKRGR